MALDGIGPDLYSLVVIENQRRQGSEVTSETRYCIANLPAEARELLRAVYSHWGGENRLHWVLDMTFREDKSPLRTGRAAHSMAILRRETTAKRKQAGWNHEYLLRVLSNWNAIALPSILAEQSQPRVNV